ncbi:MAG: hypothetical protein KAR32_13645 [Candidatus Omnitrophica bacterium]|nr:hypothetical protein [Candidatus Omnitrophota bacterium]
MARELLSVEGIQLRWRQTLDQLSSHRFNIVLISFGIILRLKLYLANSSFRLDESWLALDISTKTFAEIISAKVFSYDLPTVPPGFALIEKSFINFIRK